MLDKGKEDQGEGVRVGITDDYVLLSTMKKFIITIIILIIVGGAAFFLSNKTKVYPPQSANKKLQVVASFYPMYFFASQIGGNKADVFNITPASAEPHDYEPTTQDIARIEKANMLVLNGGALESWGQKIKDQLKGTNVYVAAAGDGVANKQLEENGKTIQDPHVWLSPPLAKLEVANITNGFIKIDPKNTDYFKANEKKLDDDLNQLDQAFKQSLSNCSKKDFVTSHAAFGYLADRYHINQIAISGISPDEEPSSQKLAEIANLVKQKNIKVVFFESLVSPKLSETIANETGAKTLVLDPIEGISDDNIKAGHTYLTIMRDNLSALQTALECSK